MATVRWRGDAPAVAQTGTLTPGGTIEVGDLFNVTINGKTVQYAATATTVASVVTGLATALEASEIPEFVEITWVDGTTAVTYTGPDDGTPVTVSVTTTEAGGGAADAQTFVAAVVTSASGPNNWNVAANWSGAAVPSSTDDVYLEDSDVDIKDGLDQDSVTLTSLNISSSYTGKIGRPYTNENDYIEYRDTYLKIKATTVNIGYGNGNGSSMINLNNSSAQTTLNLQNTASSDSNNRPTLLWKGTHNSNVVNLQKGSFGSAYLPGETATIATLNIGYKDNIQGDVEAWIGSGTTLTTVVKAGGIMETYAGATTITQNDGELSVNGSAAVTTLNVYGGEAIYNSTGTLATANVTGSGHLDFSKDMRTKTVTNPINMFGNLSKLSDPFKVVTSIVVDLEQRSTLDGLELGTNRKLTLGTP